MNPIALETLKTGFRKSMRGTSGSRACRSATTKPMGSTRLAPSRTTIGPENHGYVVPPRLA